MLASALRDKLSALAGVPAAMIPAAAASAAAAAAGLLSFNLAEVLVDGWRGHNELTVAVRRTLAAPGSTELVRLATHRITVTRQPLTCSLPCGRSGVVSALELLTCLAAAGIPPFAWYGLTAPSAAHELFHEVTTAAPATLAWSAELRVGGRRANAAGIGSGCGVLFTAADLAPAGSMRRAADAYVRAFNQQSVAADAGVYVTASFVTSAI